MENLSTQSLRDHFLIAMPSLQDPYFAHSVTYICEHNEHGAMGIIINRPIDLTLKDVLQQVGITPEKHSPHNQDKICAGGPVEMERGFVLHRCTGHWQSSLRITADIQLTTSRDILEAMATGSGPSQAIVALGYSGWDAGQLEQEILENSWLTCQARPEIIFETPMESRLNAAAAELGIELHQLCGDTGHA